MKKLILLLAICLTVICFFSSCGQLETKTLEGTWKVDFSEEYSDRTEYYTFKLIFTENKVQIIKYQYDSASRTGQPSDTFVSETIPYAAGKTGSFVATHSVDIVNQKEIAENFTLDKTNNKLVWKIGYTGKRFTLEKESSATSFCTPSLPYEIYKLDGYISKGTGKGRADFCELTLFKDGEYMIEYVNTGTWGKSKEDQNTISLVPGVKEVFSKMDLRTYSPYSGAKYKNLEPVLPVEGTKSGFEIKGDFECRYNASWYYLFYFTKD